MTIWQEDVHNGSWASLGENSHTSTEPGSLGVVVTQEAQIAGLDILHEHCMFYRIGSESDYCVQYFPRQLIFFFSLSTELCTQMDQKWIKTFPTSLFDHFFLSLLQFSYFIFLSDFSKLIDYTCTHYDHTLTHTHTTQTHTHTELPREQVWLV